MKTCLVGVVSWCDSNRFPQRFKVFKKTVNSIHKYIPKDLCTVAVVDNDSSEDVQKFIENSTVFDIKVILPENIHDVGAYGVLTRIAQDNHLTYLWLLENDYVLYRGNILQDAMNFLKKHKECGYVRMQKFEYRNQDEYNKEKKNNIGLDKENSVWLKNIVTNKKLIWNKPIEQGNSTFYINNWHFGIHGGLIKTEIWEKLYPKLTSQVPFYYKLESYMREKYNKLRLKTGVLDRGCFSMEAPSVYQKTISIPFIDQFALGLYGNKGGFIDGKIISHYQRSYKRFRPIEIQLFSNSLGENELQMLKQVFSSKWLGYGSKSKEFETQFASMIGTKYALAISSCTAGLFMSMEMLGIKKGDEVIIPSIGFIACANAVIKAGAKPVFADVDPRYLNILPSEVERLINKKTKAVMVLHYGGIPCDIDGIKKIIKKQKQKVYLIEDSANSIKSVYKGKYCGSLGDIGLFSLDVNKVITTGTGGIMATNDDDLYYKAKVMRFYGLKPNLASGYDALKARRDRWWEIDLEFHGNRYISNDITSAIGLSQLQKMDGFLRRRKEIWNMYNNRLKLIKRIKLPPKPPKNTQNSYYFYWIQVGDEKRQLSLANYLVKNGIYTTFRYYPLHMIKYYKSKQKLPNSEFASKTTLNLPFHQNLTKRNIDRIVSTIKSWDNDY